MDMRNYLNNELVEISAVDSSELSILFHTSKEQQRNNMKLRKRIQVELRTKEQLKEKQILLIK